MPKLKTNRGAAKRFRKTNAAAARTRDGEDLGSLALAAFAEKLDAENAGRGRIGLEE